MKASFLDRVVFGMLSLCAASFIRARLCSSTAVFRKDIFLNFHLLLFPGTLPLWFLVLSLFLPRICLLVAWLQLHNALPTQFAGWVPIILAAVVPRIVILLLIYSSQGVSLWFLVHLVALLLAWGGGGTRVVRRRRGDYEVVD